MLGSLVEFVTVAILFEIDLIQVMGSFGVGLCYGVCENCIE